MRNGAEVGQKSESEAAENRNKIKQLFQNQDVLALQLVHN